MRRRLIRALAAAAVAAVLCPAMADGQSVKWPSSSAPRPLPARDATFPPYTTRALANGLSVVVVAHNEQPAITVRMIVRAGAAHDPVGRPGVAAMVATLLDQGTTTRTAQQVADAIDSVGGSLDTGLGRDLSSASVTVMKDSLDVGMLLLADIIRRPAFAREELDRQRQKIAGALRVSYEDPSYVASVVFDRMVFGTHPYGFPPNGTPASLDTLTREDLVEFHRRYFAPNNCILAVVGDVTVEEAMAAVTRSFGDWQRQEIPADARIEPPKPSRRVVVLDKPDAVQTEIRMGQVGIRRKTGDFLAVDMAMRILGGEGANRLYHQLRTNRGLTYGASASADVLKHSGELVAQTSTRSDATAEVLRLMIEEFWALQREGVAEGELASVKAFLSGHYALTLETPNEIATQILDAMFYELPLEDLQTFRQRVDAVDAETVRRVAGVYLQPDRLSIVLVGNASAFLDQLKRAGFNRVEVVPLAELDLTAADFRRKGRQQ